MIHYEGCNYASTEYGLHMIYKLSVGPKVMEVVRFNNLLFELIPTGILDVNPDKDLQELITLLLKEGNKTSNASSSSSSSSRAKSASSSTSGALSSASQAKSSQSDGKAAVDRTTPFDELVTRYRHILDKIEDRLKEVDVLERQTVSQEVEMERQIKTLQDQVDASKPDSSGPSSRRKAVRAQKK